MMRIEGQRKEQDARERKRDKGEQSHGCAECRRVAAARAAKEANGFSRGILRSDEGGLGVRVELAVIKAGDLP